MSKPAIQKDNHGVTFTAKIVPGSSKTVVAGLLDDVVKIRVAAAPEKGKANQCLVAFLARRLAVKKNSVNIVSGRSNPIKQIRIMGLSPETLIEKLGLNKQGA
jgi:uncharacterized protein (TIGR00251 family)